MHHTGSLLVASVPWLYRMVKGATVTGFIGTLDCQHNLPVNKKLLVEKGYLKKRQTQDNRFSKNISFLLMLFKKALHIALWLLPLLFSRPPPQFMQVYIHTGVNFWKGTS